MEKSEAKENEQLLKKPEPQEVNSLVRTPRRNDEAVGNRMREFLKKYDDMEKEVQFTSVREPAAFARRVSIGMHYKTIHDLNDGFGDRKSACREYTLPGENQNSRIFAVTPSKIYGWTGASILFYTLS